MLSSLRTVGAVLDASMAVVTDPAAEAPESMATTGGDVLVAEAEAGAASVARSPTEDDAGGAAAEAGVDAPVPVAVDAAAAAVDAGTRLCTVSGLPVRPRDVDAGGADAEADRAGDIGSGGANGALALSALTLSMVNREHENRDGRVVLRPLAKSDRGVFDEMVSTRFNRERDRYEEVRQRVVVNKVGWVQSILGRATNTQ